MLNNDVYFELKEVKQNIAKLNEEIKSLSSKVNPKNEMWDNADMIQNWKLSNRTLASWRAKGLIGFIQVGKKIWYPRESRELFLSLYYNKSRSEEDRDGE